jgi:hypothetical protein
MDKDYGRAHYGADCRPAKTSVKGNVLAIENGEIIFIKDTVTQTLNVNVASNWQHADVLGNFITIKHPNGYLSRYCHLAHGSVKKKVGDKVKKGDIIANMGNTGLSTGAHVHFEIWTDEKTNTSRVDPIPFLTGEKTLLAGKSNEMPTNSANSSVSFNVGDKVTVKNNATDYSGGKLADFVFGKTFDVIQVGKKDHPDYICFGVDRVITAAVKAENLVKVDPTKPTVYTVNTAWLNIRTAPSLNAKFAGNAIALGEKLTSTGVADIAADGYLWANAEYKGEKCWVAKKFLK